MALIALIYARFPGSTVQLAKVLSCTIIPVFLVGPIACSYVDRWDRRRTMILCDLLRAALVILIPLFFIHIYAIWPVYIIIFLVFSVSRFFIPAKMAIIPELVSPEKLLLANSLSSITAMVAAVAGFGLGGLIVERVGSSGGFLIDALTYLISGVFILMIASRAVPYFKTAASDRGNLDIHSFIKKTRFADIKEGGRYLLHDQDVRFVTRMAFFLGSAVGAVYVVTIVFVQKTLGSITQDLGVLAMSAGLGLFFGSLVYGRFGQQFSRRRTIFISLGASGVALGIFTVCLRLFGSIFLAAGLSLVLGLSLSPLMISFQTIVHEVTEKKLRGRIFGLLEIVGYVGLFLFYFLSSFLAEKVGQFWILIFVSAILAIVGFGAIILKFDRKRLVDAKEKTVST